MIMVMDFCSVSIELVATEIFHGISEIFELRCILLNDHISMTKHLLFNHMPTLSAPYIFELVVFDNCTYKLICPDINLAMQLMNSSL